jgi:hypothetical protein
MGIVSGVLEQDPLGGHLFLFVNRERPVNCTLYSGMGLCWPSAW